MSLCDVLVLTARGLVPIGDVVVGDQVLTHEGRWRAVVGVHRRVDAPVVRMAGGGHRGMVISEDQAMLGRRNSNPQRKVNLQTPLWVTPSSEPECPQRWYVGSPVVVPSMALPPMPDGDPGAVLALMGAYVADGSVRHSVWTGRPLGLSISDDVRELPRLQGLLAALGLRGGVVTRPGSRGVRLDVTCHDLAQFAVEHFGLRSEGKRLPVWLLGAPRDLGAAFLTSYLAGDGSWDAAKGRWTASTSSKELAIGLRLLGQTQGSACGYSWVDPKVTHVMGRELKAPPRRSHRVTFTASGRNVVVDNGLAWQKVRLVVAAASADTVDLIVEDDASFIADGLVCDGGEPARA